MNATQSTIFRLAAALGLLAHTGMSSPQTLGEFQGVQHSWPWPSELATPGSFTRTDSGDLDGDAVPDVVVLDGTQPVILFAVDEWVSQVPSSVVANDLAVVRGIAPVAVDDIAVVGPAGLTRLWFDATSEQFVSVLADATAWVGAKVVVAGDVDGDGDDDLVGIGADGTTILRKQNNVTGLISLPSFVTSAQASDLVLLQWDLDLPLEIAVLNANGVEILDDTGAPATSWTHPLAGGAITRLKQAGQARDRLAWITVWAPPAQQLLMVLAQGGATDIVDLGALDTIAIENGDYDLDGDDDLLISHRVSHELVWLENERSPTSPSGPSFTANPDGTKLFRVGPPATQAPMNDARPLLADLDLDGDLDVFFPCEQTMFYEVLRGEARNEAQWRPTTGVTVWQDPAPGVPATLTFPISSPVQASAAQDEFEIEIWRRSHLGTWLDQDIVSSTYVARPASGSVSVTVAIPETSAVFEDVYMIQVRTVDRNAAGLVIARGTSQVQWFTTHEPTEAAIDAAESPVSNETVWNASSAQGGPGGIKSGTLSIMKKVKYHGADKRGRRTPQPKPPISGT